ncbi:zinc finger domain-containing protein [Streptomyces verrucosisporus]|uniref:zinc finger domain-containing protein n=1 Tax=Streptomyces verrucosisporus TaxID=1695161 RepID=UPI003FD8814A
MRGSGPVAGLQPPSPTGRPGTDDAEQHACPKCDTQTGSPCRSRGGAVASARHTRRFALVPRPGPAPGSAYGPGSRRRCGRRGRSRRTSRTAGASRPCTKWSASAATPPNSRPSPTASPPTAWSWRRSPARPASTPRASPGKPLFAFSAAMAGTEREDIRGPSPEGLDTRPARGEHGGRPPVITGDMLHPVLRCSASGESVGQIQPDLAVPTSSRRGWNPSAAGIHRALAGHAGREACPEAPGRAHADFAGLPGRRGPGPPSRPP